MEMLVNDIKEVLTCHMCENLLQNPVSMCKSSHNICKKCRIKNVVCSCKQAFLEINNTLAERLVDRVNLFGSNLEMMTIWKMDYLFTNILQNLKCQICYQYTYAPIVLCEKQHNICKNCKKASRRCPICDEYFCEIRDETIEAFAALFLRPCGNQEQGCKRKFLRHFIKAHEDNCPYYPYKCPYGSYGNTCDWKGPASDMKGHIMLHHDGCIVTKLDVEDVIYLQNYENSENWCEVVSAFDEFFYYYFEITGEFLFGYILHIGEIENSSKYKYQLKLETTSGEDSMSVSQITNSFVIEKTDLLKDGKYIQFCNNFAKRCVDTYGNLILRLSITKHVH